MKQKLMLTMACAALLAACTPTSSRTEDIVPDVTVGFRDGTMRITEGAEALLHLSAAAPAQVTVGLYMEGELTGIVECPESIEIETGVQEAAIPFTIGENDLGPGTYESELHISKVTGGLLDKRSSVLRLAYTVTESSTEGKPNVLLHRTDINPDTGKGEIYVYIDNSIDKDIAVTLGQLDKVSSKNAVKLPEESLTYEKEVLIPAGKKSVTVPVELDMSVLVGGKNEAVIAIVSVSSNAAIGSSSEILFSVQTSSAVYPQAEWTAVYDGIEKQSDASGDYYYFTFTISGTGRELYTLKWVGPGEEPTNLVSFCEEVGEECQYEYAYYQYLYPNQFSYLDFCYSQEGHVGAFPELESATPTSGKYTLYIVGLYSSLSTNYQYAKINFNVN